MSAANGAVARFDPKETTARLTVLLDERADQLRSLIGPDERLYERFRTVALHAITSDPKVLQAEPASIIEAIRDSATLGLEPNGLMGEGHVIAYGRKAQFQPGYRGLLKLARRSREIASIDAQCVYEADEFSIDLGSDPRIVHRPALGPRGSRIGVYGYARLTSGELVIEWMPNAEVELVRRSSQSGTTGPWVQWPDEMARKTVIKRLCKRLPLDHLAERALELEARADAAEEPVRPARPMNGTSAVARVQQRLGVARDDSDDVIEGEVVEATSGEPSESSSPEASRPREAGGSAESPPAQAGAPANGGRTRSHTPGPSMPAPDAEPRAALVEVAADGADNPSAPPTEARCPGFDKEKGACVRDPGHSANHRNKDGETWA